MAKGPSEDPRQNLRNFLKALGSLSKHYGLQIGGCGDCGSPWISGMSRNAGTHLQHLHYCRSCKKYGSYADHSGCGG